MPNAASEKVHTLSTRLWGAWSVAMASISPARRPCTKAAASATVRRGGFTLAAVS